MIEDLEGLAPYSGGDSPVIKPECIVCMRKFSRTAPRQKTCSLECRAMRKRAVKARQRAENRELYRAYERKSRKKRGFTRKTIPIDEYNRLVEELNALRALFAREAGQ